MATPEGVVATIGKGGRVNPSSVRKAALAGPSFADALTTLANLPLDQDGTAKVTLT